MIGLVYINESSVFTLLQNTVFNIQEICHAENYPMQMTPPSSLCAINLAI